MRAIDVFDVMGNPWGFSLGQAKQKVLACPLAGSKGLYVLHYPDDPAALVSSNAWREEDLAQFDATKLDQGDPKCALPAGMAVTYPCPVGPNVYQLTDVRTGQRVTSAIQTGAPPDDPLCPDYAYRLKAAEAAAAAVPPTQAPSGIPVQNLPRVVLIPYPQQGPQPAPGPAPAPAGAPAETPAPPKPGGGISTTALVAGGVGAAGLIAVVTGVFG